MWTTANSFPCVVKPDTTPEEVTAVVENTDGTGGQIFSQAVCSLVPRSPWQNLPICGLKSFRYMVNPEHCTRKFRIIMKTSRRLSTRLKSLLSCTTTYTSTYYPPGLTTNLWLQMRVLVPQRDESIDSIYPPRVEGMGEVVVTAQASQKKWWKRWWFYLCIIIFSGIFITGTIIGALVAKDYSSG